MKTLALVAALTACSADRTIQRQPDEPDAPVGDAVMVLEPSDALVWTDVEVGNTYGANIEVFSEGDSNLHLYEARVTASAGGTFYLPDEWLSEKEVAPGNSVAMTLTASPTKDAPVFGTLRIKSNDADNLEWEMALEAWPLGTDPTTGSDTGE